MQALPGTDISRNLMAALEKLPNELLLQICRHVSGDITQLIRDDGAHTRPAYVARVSGLVSLTKTSKKLEPAVREVLYESAVLGDVTQALDTDSALYDADRSPIIALSRTLVARPELQRQLRVLQLVVPGSINYTKNYNRQVRGE